VFSAFLKQGILTESEVCLFEVICAGALLFRLWYLSAAHDAILGRHIERLRRKGLRPSKVFTKFILIGAFFLLCFVIALMFPGRIRAYEETKVVIIFTSVTFYFLYVIPEVLFYVWLIIYGKMDNYHPQGAQAP
jgi:hypothetical protein